MGARNESEALGCYLALLRRRWASAAVRETARELLFVGVRGDPGDQAGLCGLANCCEAARCAACCLSGSVSGAEGGVVALVSVEQLLLLLMPVFLPLFLSVFLGFSFHRALRRVRGRPRLVSQAPARRLWFPLLCDKNTCSLVLGPGGYADYHALFRGQAPARRLLFPLVELVADSLRTGGVTSPMGRQAQGGATSPRWQGMGDPFGITGKVPDHRIPF